MHAGELLERIRSGPDDDVPRLEYADACEPHDPERAEFIRAQCRLERLPARSAERSELDRRAGELLKAHRRRWMGPDAGRVAWCTFRRGFCDEVAISPEEPPSLLESLLALHPIRSLTFADGDNVDLTRPPVKSLATWADAPVLSRIETLDGSEQALGGEAWQVLLRSPHLSGLPTLVIGDPDATPETAAAVAAEPGPRLRRLVFRGFMSACVGDEGVARLSRAPHLAGLEHLGLWNCACSSGTGAALAGGSWIGSLRELHLGLGQYSLNRIGPRGARDLAGGRLPRLETLDLDFNEITDEGGLAVLDSPGFPSLACLMLQSNGLTNAALRPMLRIHERMPALSLLDLSHNAIGDDGAELLASCPAMQRLGTLWLYGNRVGPRGVVALAASPRSAALRELNLTGNPLGTGSAAVTAALVESPYLSGLERLFIERCGLTEDDLASLRRRFGRGLRAQPVEAHPEESEGPRRGRIVHVGEAKEKPT